MEDVAIHLNDIYTALIKEWHLDKKLTILFAKTRRPTPIDKYKTDPVACNILNSVLPQYQNDLNTMWVIKPRSGIELSYIRFGYDGKNKLYCLIQTGIVENMKYCWFEPRTGIVEWKDKCNSRNESGIVIDNDGYATFDTNTNIYWTYQQNGETSKCEYCMRILALIC